MTQSERSVSSSFNELSSNKPIPSLDDTLRSLRLVLEQLVAANKSWEVDPRRHFYKMFNREADEEAGRSVLRSGLGIHHRYSTRTATGLQRDELHRPDDVAERHLRDPKPIRYSCGTGFKGICGSGSVVGYTLQ